MALSKSTHTSITKILTLIFYIIYFLPPFRHVKVVLVANCGAIRLKSFQEATLRDVTSRKILRAAARNANMLFTLTREDTEGQPVDTPAASVSKVTRKNDTNF